jgi:hypothetical protein
VALAGCASTGLAQTLAPAFASDYSITDLGSPGSVPGPLGGITFLNDNTILIGGNANNGLGAIYSVPITRGVDNVITGFAGPGTLYASAANIDGGLAFGPEGVLFYSTFNTNTIGQIKPGSVGPDKIITGASLGVASSTGTLQFVPTGFPGAGRLKIASYSSSLWYSASVVADGSGTYDITDVSAGLLIGGGPEGIVYISDENTGFDNASVLVSEFDAGRVAAYEIDANGDPITSTRRDFITGLTGAEGAAIDPVTGAFLFSTFGGGNRVIVVNGFVPIPEPVTLSLVATASVLVLRRR